MKVTLIGCGCGPENLTAEAAEAMRKEIQKRLPAGEDGGAAVAFFFGGIHVKMIPLRRDFGLIRLHFCFLQAEEIRVGGAEIIQKALAHAGAQAVYIP